MNKKLVLKYALQNAFFYEGRANPKAVLGKIMSASRGKGDVDKLRELVLETVKEVNSLSPEEQKKRLEKLAPELLKKEKKETGLPELKNAELGKVVTRFAPCPSGPLNLLQALRAVLLSHTYAKKYKGRFLLRFEDTDPRVVEKPFYKMIEQDLRSLEARPDSVFIESENMDAFYKYAEQLINEGVFYIDFTPAEDFKKLKLRKKESMHRDAKPQENLNVWKDMLKGKYKEGECVVRMKTSMKNPNPAFRDPPMLRIIKSRHPLAGDKYCVWPVYNFANAIEDHITGVTHVFRGKEHEHNTWIQEKIYLSLGWKAPTVVNFGMIYLPGEKIHTRDIKAGIKSGKYSGWDDVRLPTIRSLLRRGFLPDAIKEFSDEVSLSKTDIKIDWRKFETINRKILDPKANRYMVVIDPVCISIKGAPKTDSVKVYLHPDFPERGKKTIPVSLDYIYLSGQDWKDLAGKEIRLKALGNIKLKLKDGFYTDNRIIQDMPKIQWVSKPNIHVEVVKPDGVVKGLGEPAMKKLKAGCLIQMERVGFGRIDKVSNGKIIIYFAHK